MPVQPGQLLPPLTARIVGSALFAGQERVLPNLKGRSCEKVKIWSNGWLSFSPDED
jgi:hypothetical protein